KQILCRSIGTNFARSLPRYSTTGFQSFSMKILTFLTIFLLGLRYTAATEGLDHETYSRLVVAAGGEEQFLDVLRSVSDHATSLHNGIKNVLEGSFVG